LAALQGQDAIGAAGKIQMVSYVDRSQAAGPMQFVEKVHDHLAGPEIEAPGGLVGEQHLGVAHQRAGQHDPLLFASRELAGAMPRTISQSNFIEPR
jgi:hypothetical protein